MRAIDFNKDWTWKYLDAPGAGIPVTLPHDAMLRENRSSNSAGAGNVAWFAGRDYLYSKTFFVPEAYRDHAVVLEFEGVYRKALVSINGVEAGYRPYGYTNFYVSADQFLRFGEQNTVTVVVRNADQPNSRWYSGAGIYRPVTMWVAPQAHILPNGVKIRTEAINPVRASVSVQTSAAGLVQVSFLDSQGKILASGRQQSDGDCALELEVPDARPWSCEDPALYTCCVRFGEDTWSTVFGFRQLAWGPDRGLTVNGERVILRGACIHHDNGILGACTFPEAEERRLRILKEYGYNAIRSAHNPCSKALLDACDRLGMLLMDEYVDCWYIHKTMYDYVEDFDQWWRDDLREMVDKDYNHPCVIMYSTGNEVSETAQPRGIALTGQMTQYLHKLDPTRPVTCGINLFFNYLSSLGFGVYTDEKAQKEARQQKKHPVGSEFYNRLAALLGDKTMKLGATLPGCDRKTRDAFANLDVAGYNYGLLRYARDLKKYPDRLILGTETFCRDAYAFWEQARENPRLLGDFVWAGMDYLGEVGIEADREDGLDPTSLINSGSGRIDLIGNPVGEAAYTMVAFEQTQQPVIAVQPVCRGRRERPASAWKMSNAIMSWAWEGMDGAPAVVEVYARAASVVLQVNGKTVGRKKLGKGCRAVFRTIYESGTVTAISYDRNGHETGRSQMQSAAPETVLHLAPENPRPKPGELCFIRLAYADPSGIVKPLADDTITLQVKCGELVGLGNACPYHKRGYLTNQTETWYGRGLAAIRADEHGRIHVLARDSQRQVELCIRNGGEA